jgi:hypothetical protein
MRAAAALKVKTALFKTFRKVPDQVRAAHAAPAQL